MCSFCWGTWGLAVRVQVTSSWQVGECTFLTHDETYRVYLSELLFTLVMSECDILCDLLLIILVRLIHLRSFWNIYLWLNGNISIMSIYLPLLLNSNMSVIYIYTYFSDSPAHLGHIDTLTSLTHRSISLRPSAKRLTWAPMMNPRMFSSL